MLFAGIGWSSHGFDVALMDGARPVAGVPVRFRKVPDLIGYLRGLDRRDLVCVVESTNGMIDGGMMTAGLCVYRADPPVLPARPGFGSVTAQALAEVAARRLTDLTRLNVNGGSLTGRGGDDERSKRGSEADLAALSQAGRCVVHGDRSAQDKVIALTFDDGPHPPYTTRILDVLDRYGARATFFCVGLHASIHTEHLARMAAAGHQIGNHTWSHAFIPDLSVSEAATQLDRTAEVIAGVAGVGSSRPLFRPPYGAYSQAFTSWLRQDEDGPTMVLWDICPDDWALPGTDVIARTVLEHAKPGSIVTLHDGGGDRSQTAHALPIIIDGLLEKGFRLVTVDELIASGSGPA